MKKIFNYITVAIIALTTATVFTSCDEDEMEAWTLDGTWTGYVETYYRDRWGWEGSQYRTAMYFDKRNTYGGTGYEVDYNVNSRYDDYYYSDFDWEVKNGEIIIYYADANWAPTYIYDYKLTSSYFDGYMDDGTHHDIRFRFNSDNSFRWSDYRRGYRAITRGASEDGKQWYASGAFAKRLEELRSVER